MRRFWFIAALALATVSVSNLAEAKKTETADAPANPADVYKMEITGNQSLDDFFAKAQAPLTTIVTARTAVDSIGTNLNSALGLTAGTPFADALADLKTKAGDKIAVAIDAQGMPKLAATDAVPANVQASIDAVNAAVANAQSALTACQALPDQFAALITEGKGLASADKLKELGADPTKLPKLLSVSKKNLTTLESAKNEPSAMMTAMTGMVDQLKSAFPAK